MYISHPAWLLRKSLIQNDLLVWKFIRRLVTTICIRRSTRNPIAYI